MSDELLMHRALDLAEQGRYSTSPNPMVGCVLARDGEVLAEGFHSRAGEPHAEIEALQRCSDPRGSTLFVTLEPCAHHGRTPPCADAIVRAGVARVVFAMRDPNPVVNGEGAARLRAAGIEVTEGILEGAARRLNERFVWSVTRQLPYVLLKAAMTLDGKLATITRESQWITAEAARERSLMLREEFDAIMIGSGTVAADNPRLSRRLGLNGSITPWTRVIVDGHGELSPHAQVFSDGGRTVLFSPKPPDGLPPEVEAIEMPAPQGRLDLTAILRAVHGLGIQSVIVEGGSLLHSDFIARGLWQKLVLFVAPAIVGGAQAPSIFGGDAVHRLADAYRFRFDHAELVGRDLMVTAYSN